MQNNHDAVLYRLEKPTTSILKRDYLAMKPLIQWLRDVAPRYASGTLVDFGCGNKPYLSFFINKVDRYIGVDLVQNKFNTVDMVINHREPLPLAPHSVNVILSTQVLEHVVEPAWYLGEVSRVLRPGGVLILSCPGSYMLHEEPYDYYRFTIYGLKYLLEKNGLQILRIDTAGGAWRLIGQILLNHKTFGRKFRIPILSGIMYYLWVVATNIVFSLLDRLNRNEKDTANYMVVAQI